MVVYMYLYSNPKSVVEDDGGPQGLSRSGPPTRKGPPTSIAKRHARLAIEQLTGIKVCAQTIANWVTQKGRLAKEKLSGELTAFDQKESPSPQQLSDELQSMALALAADGVIRPF